MMAERLGPFDSPYAPAFINEYSQTTTADFPRFERQIAQFVRTNPPDRAADVFETSRSTREYILASGREFLPVGGFTGQVPTPSLAVFKRDVAEGRTVRVTVATQPLTRAPDLLWVASHCQRSVRYYVPIERVTMTIFSCSAADAGGGS
jgi:hypothetical protein